MEKRVLIAVVLCIIVLVLWEKFFIPKRKPLPPSTSPKVEETAPTSAKPDEVQPQPAQPPPSEPPAATTPSLPSPTARASRDVVVDTPLYRAVFTETGSRLKSFVLKKYKETNKKNSLGKELVKTSQIEDLPLFFNFANHPVAALNLAQYVADTTSVKLEQGKKTVSFTYEAPDWLRISQHYIFHADSYLIELTVKVENLGSKPWEDAPTLSLINLPFSASGGGRYSFEGPAVLMNNELEEVKFKKIKGGIQFPKQFPGPSIDWIAYTNQYFTMAVVPLNLSPNRARIEAMDTATQMVQTTLVGPKVALQPGDLQQFLFKLYLGPKDAGALKAADAKLEKVINYGFFGFIAEPLLWCLEWINRITHNYGVAIIVLTVLIKILFWPLTHKSYVSMQAMKKLQPKMAKIKEKYKDDREKMNQEVMQLYRTYKVNPLGGCLPMVLQIPVFFALYRVLYSALAVRHAPFALWINDLSAPDRLSLGFEIPYLGGLPVLTILMGVSMFLQQKMSPTSVDPRQEKMMLMMPVVFTVLFVNFPSGLVLYWLVNNVLSIAQQYYINKKAA